jgi:hypothetical protein
MIKITNSAGARPRTRHDATPTRRGKAIRSALAVLALATLAATPASARPFQQYLNGACTGKKICKINFAQVPTGQRLLVNNASCYVRMGRDPGSNNTALRATQILVVGPNTNNVLSAVTLLPIPFSQTEKEVVFAANSAISAFANAQQRMQAYVEIDEGSFSQVACHISGDLAKA